MKRHHTLCILALFLNTFATHAYGKTIKGFIRSSGSKLNYRVIIKEKGGKVSHTLCPSALSKEMDQYPRMFAAVEVEKSDQCLVPLSYQLLTTPSGTDPIVGTLLRDGKHFSIAYKNKKYMIKRVPKRMLSFINKRVVLELGQSKSKKSNDKLYHILFLAPAPTKAK